MVAGEEGCVLGMSRSWVPVLVPMGLGKFFNLLQFSFFCRKMGIEALPPGCHADEMMSGMRV